MIRALGMTIGTICFAVAPLCATTLVVKVEKHRILIAADNRVGITVFENARYQDDVCKLQTLGHTVVGIAGTPVHFHAQGGRAVADWNAMSDARAAFDLSHDNTENLGRKWGDISAAHIASFAQTDPSVVLNLSAPGSIIYGGLFLSWRFGTPILWVEYIDREAGNKIVARDTTLLQEPREQSTNKVTQELIEGKSSRAKGAARRWKSISGRYPLSQRSWRYLEFLVQETSKFDLTVSPSSDILEILDSGKTSWVKKAICGKIATK